MRGTERVDGALPPVLEARGVHHAFGARRVLIDVDISVAAGEVVGLVGPNGSGKTTALRILHHAIVPDAGRVVLEGRDLGDYAGRDRARRIAVTSQDLVGELPLTVADVVLLGRLPHVGALGTVTGKDLDVVTEALEALDALPLARQEFNSLSGGERQRVLVARALAQQPRVLLMDEPTNHLDIASQHQVLGTVLGRGQTTIVVLHDLNLAARYCDRVIVLDQGVVKANAAPSRALTPDLIGSTYDVLVEQVTAADGASQFLFSGLQPGRSRVTVE